MTDYNKLVKALRCVGLSKKCDSCDYGYHLYEDSECNDACDNERLDRDAADAIKKLVTLHEKVEMDATNLTGKLAQAEAEVERLKYSNEELREKQTYIDHYGAEWMTSAKDVPTSAYEHGYADGRDEARAKMEVQDA